MEMSSMGLLGAQGPLMSAPLALWGRQTWIQVSGHGVGGCRFSHAPPLPPFSSVNKWDAFAVANGRGRSSRGGLLKTESWGPQLVLTLGPARSTGGEERPLRPALRPKSQRNPGQAVPVGPTANDTGSGASMYPAAPQASRPDLPSNSAQ